jgi:CRISPR-associated endonuclease/helicase Cas3
MKYHSHPNYLLLDHVENMFHYDQDDALFAIAVRFHDLGKVLDSFQTYIQAPKDHYSEPHALVSALLYLVHHSNIGKEISKHVLFVFNAIVSHHGGLKSFNNPNGEDILELFNNVPYDQIEEIYAKDDVTTYFQLEDKEFSNIRKYKRANRDRLFSLEDYVTQKLLFSKLIFADKYEAIFKSVYQKPLVTFTKKMFQDYLHDQNINDPKRNQIRQDIVEKLEEKYAIYTVTAPTGVGKTLISLDIALNLLEQRGHTKIIYALPFTSIIDQTYTVFDAIFPKQITKHHYAVTFNDDEEEKNDYDRWKFLLNSWNEPFIVSTLYQLFFALFSKQNSDNIKLQAMQNSVIIIDEVQAIPFSLWHAFKALLPHFAKQLNATFVLMSATMPILNDPKTTKELANKRQLFKEKNRYALKYFPDNRLDALAKVIIAEYAQEKSVLCVVNTIANAKALFKLIKEKVDASYCLNSYMFIEDRKAVIKALKEKDSSHVNHKVLISTQVVEAGVDLDFDVGFREFAPLSSIIQIAGRINREGNKGLANLYVFDTIVSIYDATMISESEKVLFDRLKEGETVYENEILAITERYFEQLDIYLESDEVLEAITTFDFETINQENKKAFRAEQEDYIESIAVGIDLRSFEEAYYAISEDLQPYEKKREKQKLMALFQHQVLNIKKKDLTRISPNRSELFGLSYIDTVEGVYSTKSGFLLQGEEDDFFYS